MNVLLIQIRAKYQMKKYRYSTSRNDVRIDRKGALVIFSATTMRRRSKWKEKVKGAPVRQAKLGTLKAEAKTLSQICALIVYRDPYCEALHPSKDEAYFGRCVELFQRELKVWGDLIDFLDMRKASDAGMGFDDGVREVLVVRYVATRVIAAIPTESCHTEKAVNALRRLIGRRKVNMAYSDDALEFNAAMAERKIPIDHSLPGKAEQQFSCRKNESGGDQHSFHIPITCWVTCAVLDICSELCHAQSSPW